MLRLSTSVTFLVGKLTKLMHSESKNLKSSVAFKKQKYFMEKQKILHQQSFKIF